jgi:hypothetical protein
MEITSDLAIEYTRILGYQKFHSGLDFSSVTRGNHPDRQRREWLFMPSGMAAMATR